MASCDSAGDVQEQSQKLTPVLLCDLLAPADLGHHVGWPLSKCLVFLHHSKGRSVSGWRKDARVCLDLRNSLSFYAHTDYKQTGHSRQDWRLPRRNTTLVCILPKQLQEMLREEYRRPPGALRSRIFLLHMMGDLFLHCHDASLAPAETLVCPCEASFLQQDPGIMKEMSHSASVHHYPHLMQFDDIKQKKQNFHTFPKLYNNRHVTAKIIISPLPTAFPEKQNCGRYEVRITQIISWFLIGEFIPPGFTMGPCREDL
ncbi:uncharacterized protein ACNLHF_000155 [Anomaloglossus baeobatrachus]